MMRQYWSIDCENSKLLTNRLNSYIIAQQELFQALSEVKHLEICRTTTYVDQKSGFLNLDLTYVSGKNTTRTVTIHTNEESKVML